MKGSMRLLAALICIGLLTGASAAFAAECDDSSNQHEFHVCADQDYIAANAAMDGVVQVLADRLSSDNAGKQRLEAAQKAWAGFRDAECDFQTADYSQGTIYPMLVLICLKDMTKTRTDELRVFLDCDEGDTLCPVPAPAQ